MTYFRYIHEVACRIMDLQRQSKVVGTLRASQVTCCGSHVAEAGWSETGNFKRTGETSPLILNNLGACDDFSFVFQPRLLCVCALQLVHLILFPATLPTKSLQHEAPRDLRRENDEAPRLRLSIL